MEILSTIFIFSTTPFLIFLTIFLYHIISIYIGKSINNPDYPPVRGTVYGQLFYFNKLYEYHTEFSRTQRTYRLLTPNHSNVFIADPRNVEHILKTKFEMYSKGKYNKDIMSDVFGEGIFLVDGDKWRQQRKLASFEFSTRVLRDFSCAVFRRNAAKLVRVILQITIADQAFDMQVNKPDPSFFLSCLGSNLALKMNVAHSPTYCIISFFIDLERPK